jgi:hypothetical protein
VLTFGCIATSADLGPTGLSHASDARVCLTEHCISYKGARFAPAGMESPRQTLRTLSSVSPPPGYNFSKKLLSIVDRHRLAQGKKAKGVDSGKRCGKFAVWFIGGRSGVTRWRV